MSDSLDALAGSLSGAWLELGTVLRNRRLLAALHHGSTAKLTPTNVRALDVLGGSGGLRVGELATRMGIDETSATRLADRLEAAGLAARRADAADRRVTVVVLTATGAKLSRVVADQRRRFFRDVLAALEPDERVELVRLTAKAAAAVKAAGEDLIAR